MTSKKRSVRLPNPGSEPGVNTHFLEKLIGRKWEGLNAWLPVVRGNDAVQGLWPAADVEGVKSGSGEVEYPPSDLLSVPELLSIQNMSLLANARPIRIGVGQLLALPDWHREDGSSGISKAACQYGEDLRPPFLPTFFDFCDDRGNPAWLKHTFVGYNGREAKACLYGAIVACFEEENFDGVKSALFMRNALTVIPFGATLKIREEGGERELQPIHRGPLERKVDEQRLPPAAPLGYVSFGGMLPGAVPIKADPVVVFGDMTEKSRPKEIRPTLGLVHAMPLYNRGDYSVYAGVGTADLVRKTLQAAEKEEIPPKLGVHKIPPESRVEIGTVAEATIVSLQVDAVIRTLALLESANVELVDVPVSRQVRRQAERSGGEVQIAQTINVKLRRRVQSKETVSTNGSAGRHFRYSHDREGHYRHVTRGAHAKTDKVKPCPFWRERHPHSEVCRREYIPPTVIDAGEGKPYVPKTRVVR